MGTTRISFWKSKKPLAIANKGVNLTLILLSMTMNRTSLVNEIIWKYSLPNFSTSGFSNRPLSGAPI